ncbi:MAG: MFS transporter [Lachnospiraceae bacterium]|nr:MFS transporter [Lachnospiraceae bacterium]
MNERRELKHLLKERAKKNGKYYLIGLFFLLTAIYVVDEIASNINSAMQPYVILDLFKIPSQNVLSKEYASAVGVFTIITMVSYVMMLIAPFYKALADRFGRKLFLILNTFLMGVGMFICMISPNYIFYIFGALVITFVKSNDMQVMYIIETAPKEHRAKICNLTKAIGLISVSLIGVLRSIFYDENNITTWRMVFLIPAIIAILVALICIPFIRETPVFVEQRILELNNEAEKENVSEQRGGVFSAFKMIWTNRQLRNIMIASVCFALVTGITSYYTTVLEAANGMGKITSGMINTILIIFPFVNGVFTLLCGFVSDSVGRKKACFIFSIIASIGLILFSCGARMGWSAEVIGIGWGMFIGTLWSITDTLVLVMPAESTPTSMRASVMGVMSLLLSAGMALSIILFVIGLKFLGASSLGIFALCVCIPLMIISCVMLSKVEETKGNDLDSI